MVDVATQKTSDNHKVEGWLLHWEDRLLEYQASRQDVLEASPRQAEVVTSQGFKPSDHTGDKGVKLATLAEQEPWLMFVKDFETYLGSTPHLLVVLRLRRQYRDYRGRRGWVAPVQVRFPGEMEAITGEPAEVFFRVHRNTFHGYWREVVDLAAREAIRRGLL